MRVAAQRPQCTPQTHERRRWPLTTLLAVSLLLLYLYSVYRTWTLLETSRLLFLEEQTTTSLLGRATTSDSPELHRRNSRTPSSFDTSTPRYIWVESLRGAAQGVGNSLHGLLAAHLLGDEFNRTVCVSPKFTAWHVAFVPRSASHAQDCRQLAEAYLQQQIITNVPTIQLVNFLPTPPNECRVQETLRSNSTLLKFLINTYPSWPTVPPDYLQRFYQPTAALSQLLPDAEVAATTVVHLRAPDHAKTDARAGLDPRTLQALAATLPSNGDTYLVTNQVSYYTTFANWSHPHWESVAHSGGLRGVEWTTDANAQASPNASRSSNNSNSSSLTDLQTMADWYTIYLADTVYHTPSDFSSSARHWRGGPPSIPTTWEIRGTARDTGELDVQPDAWARDPPLAPLVERTREGVGSYALRNCKGAGVASGGLGRVVSAVRVLRPAN